MEEVYLIKMEWLRYQMIQLAKERGLNDPAVLEISQQIDELHNKLNQLHQEKQQNSPTGNSKPNNRMYLKEDNIHPYIAIPI